jgi:hypothetical protein
MKPKAPVSFVIPADAHAPVLLSGGTKLGTYPNAAKLSGSIMCSATQAQDLFLRSSSGSHRYRLKDHRALEVWATTREPGLNVEFVQRAAPMILRRSGKAQGNPAKAMIDLLQYGGPHRRAPPMRR